MESFSFVRTRQFWICHRLWKENAGKSASGLLHRSANGNIPEYLVQRSSFSGNSGNIGSHLCLFVPILELGSFSFVRRSLGQEYPFLTSAFPWISGNMFISVRNFIPV